jgi:hypothetical protein
LTDTQVGVRSDLTIVRRTETKRLAIVPAESKPRSYEAR